MMTTTMPSSHWDDFSVKKIQYVVFPGKWLTSLSKYQMSNIAFTGSCFKAPTSSAAPTHLCCSRLWWLWEDGEWWWVCCVYLYVSVFVCGSVLFCFVFCFVCFVVGVFCFVHFFTPNSCLTPRKCKISHVTRYIWFLYRCPGNLKMVTWIQESTQKIR